MKPLSRNPRALVATAVAAAALAAVAASPAMAEIVSAKFSSNTMKMTTTGITIKKAGADPKTCTLKDNPFGTAGENYGWAYNEATWLRTKLYCTGGSQFSFRPFYFAKYNTSTGLYSLKHSTSSEQTSPWGTYYQYVEPEVAWTNGSGGTQSTLTYNETQIGFLTEPNGPKVTMTGTFTVTTTANGLLTLSH